jgi:hypothetical protein
MWSGFQGLFNRDEKGKKAELITQNADKVAKILLHPNATAADLGNVERILAALPNGANDPRAQHAITDPAWPKVNESNNWYRNIIDRLTESAPLYTKYEVSTSRRLRK